jgi:hypothetical protein
MTWPPWARLIARAVRIADGATPGFDDVVEGLPDRLRRSHGDLVVRAGGVLVRRRAAGCQQANQDGQPPSR